MPRRKGKKTQANKPSQEAQPKPMPTPTFVVGARDFRLLCSGIGQYVIHGRKGLKVVPPVAQEIGENEVVFPNAPKQIVFRKRLSTLTITRDVRFITADNSDRFDLVFYVNLKEISNGEEMV